MVSYALKYLRHYMAKNVRNALEFGRMGGVFSNLYGELQFRCMFSYDLTYLTNYLAKKQVRTILEGRRMGDSADCA